MSLTHLAMARNAASHEKCRSDCASTVAAEELLRIMAGLGWSHMIQDADVKRASLDAQNEMLLKEFYSPSDLL